MSSKRLFEYRVSDVGPLRPRLWRRELHKFCYIKHSLVMLYLNVTIVTTLFYFNFCLKKIEIIIFEKKEKKFEHRF